jgi:integrase
MSALAPTLEAFFTDRLIHQRAASPHTIAAYRDTFRLLLRFAHERTRRAPATLRLEDLDAPLMGAFLEYLETGRHNGVPTRNARLAAIHAFFRFAAWRHPEHAALIQRVLAIPPKRGDRQRLTFLEAPEIAALLAAPDRTRWVGRRDHTLLVTAIQTGLWS